LEFSDKCRRLEAGCVQLDEFVRSNEAGFLTLSPAELQHCAEVSLRERGGSGFVARRLLAFAIQLLSRHACPDYGMIGKLYKKIIKLSSSRQEVSELSIHKHSAQIMTDFFVYI
jgi:hypothetical protein